jgi:hypothetical protein
VSIAKVRNHVHYLKANGRLQSARITTVDSQTQLDLQIGHHTTLLNKLKYVSGSQTDKWRKTA